MSFQKGAMTFRVFTAAEPISLDCQNQLRENAYKKFEGVELGTALLDVTRGVSLVGEGTVDPLTLEFSYGGNLFFAVRSRKQDKNASMVKEFFQYLVDKEVKTTGYAPRGKRKKELKEAAIQLASTNPVTKITGTRVVGVPDSKFVVMDASSVTKCCDTTDYIKAEIMPNNDLSLIDPDYLYTLISKKGPETYIPYKINGKLSATGIGADFLTWLWAASETDGVLPADTIVSLCGDLSFRRDGDSEDSHGNDSILTTMAKGVPWEGDGAQAAFHEGKKLKAAIFRIAKGESTYEFSLDETFLFNKVTEVFAEESDDEAEGDDGEEKSKKKSDGKRNPEDLFVERIEAVREISETVFGLFNKFMSSLAENEQFVNDWLSHRWE